MKYVMCFIGPGKYPEPYRTEVMIQIENWLSMNIPERSIINAANFNFSHMGIDSFRLNDNCDMKIKYPNQGHKFSKYKCLLDVMQRACEPDELIWFFDTDSFQVRNVDAPIETTKYDICLTTYPRHSHSKLYPDISHTCLSTGRKEVPYSDKFKQTNTGVIFLRNNESTRNILKHINKYLTETWDDEDAFDDLRRNETYENLHVLKEPKWNWDISCIHQLKDIYKQSTRTQLRKMSKKVEDNAVIVQFHPSEFAGDNYYDSIIGDTLTNLFKKYGYYK